MSGWMGTENLCFCENSKKNKKKIFWGGRRVGCERRSKVFVKIKKKKN